MELEGRWPVLARHARAAEWLRIWADLGRAPRTIDAYARGLVEYLQVCERDGIDPLAANRAQVAAFVRDLTGRPSRRGGNVVALDSGAGLANATLQQRLVPVRLFYDFLIEEGLRESNPVGRGRYTPGGGRGAAGGRRGRWCRGWSSCRGSRPSSSGATCSRRSAVEPIRNRLMLALAYDAALRREELCSLRTDDLDPAHRMLRIRAETTKTRRERVVPYSAPTGVLLAQYLRAPGHDQPGPRAAVLVGVAPQPRRAADLVDLVEGGPPDRGGRRGAPVLHAHDAAPVSDRPGPDRAGSCTRSRPSPGTANLDSTMRYIHLSGRDLSDKLNRGDGADPRAGASACSPSSRTPPRG